MVARLLDSEKAYPRTRELVSLRNGCCLKGMD